jgi:hypothetical protein
MTVEKIAPPRKTRETYPWTELADNARDNPGEWFRMAVANRSYASFIKAGRYSAFRDDVDQWEVTTRDEDGTVYVYVRYSEV